MNSELNPRVSWNFISGAHWSLLKLEFEVIVPVLKRLLCEALGLPSSREFMVGKWIASLAVFLLHDDGVWPFGSTRERLLPANLRVS